MRIRARVRMLTLFIRRNADFCCVCTMDAPQSDTSRIANAHAWRCHSTRCCSMDGDSDKQSTEAERGEDEKSLARAPCTRCVALRCDTSCVRVLVL